MVGDEEVRAEELDEDDDDDDDDDDDEVPEGEEEPGDGDARALAASPEVSPALVTPALRVVRTPIDRNANGVRGKDV